MDISAALNTLNAWISAHASLLGTIASILGGIAAVVAFVWPILQWILVRKRDAQNRDFEIYHRLIKELIQGDAEDKMPMVDRQCALLFELRGFKQYHPITYRIVAGLYNNEWRYLQTSEHRVAVEIRLLLKYIKATGCDLEVNATTDASMGLSPAQHRETLKSQAAPNYRPPGSVAP